VVIHTTMSHVPNPEQLIEQAFRVLCPGGWFAVFDGDYATATVARQEFDPLQACVAAFRTNFVNKRRSEDSRWFGHIAFASVVARKPGQAIEAWPGHQLGRR
jgi:ubiquinone/menaquinone biosynthesis C-methylase UbiE